MNRSRVTEVASGTFVVAGTAAIVLFGVQLFTGPDGAVPAQTPAATSSTVDLASIPYTNGLASEQEAAAATAVRAEQDRIAAEQAAAAAAEAARVAAEQAAAAEAERIAAEQAAAEESYVDSEYVEPADPWAGKTPVPFIADPNPENAAGGFYDTSQCPSGSASTGPDGVPYCD